MDSSCPYLGRCKNGPRACYRCRDFSLLKLPEEKEIKRRQRRIKRAASKKNDLTGRSFEEEIAARLSLPPEAQPQPGSGNRWTSPGDDAYWQVLIDAKERQPIVARGSTQITLKKEWVDKILEEAATQGKIGVVCYRLRGDDRIYCILPFEALHALIHRALSD